MTVMVVELNLFLVTSGGRCLGNTASRFYKKKIEDASGVQANDIVATHPFKLGVNTFKHALIKGVHHAVFYARLKL